MVVLGVVIGRLKGAGSVDHIEPWKSTGSSFYYQVIFGSIAPATHHASMSPFSSHVTSPVWRPSSQSPCSTLLRILICSVTSMSIYEIVRTRT